MAGAATMMLAGAVSAFVSTGVEYSSGDYGLPQDTTVLIAPLSVELSAGSAFFRAAASYARLDGPADLIVIDGVAQGTRPAAQGQTVRTGFSDLALSAGYGWIPPAARDLLIDLSVGVELPTGDEVAGFGTGGVDYFGGLDLVYDTGAAVWSAGVGYERIEDARGANPVAYRNPWSASLSATRRLGGGAYMGAGVNARQAIVSGFDGSADLSVFAGRPLYGPVSIGAHLFVGLTDASPDMGGGLTLSWSPGR
jgi:hypothetical protein